LGAAFFVAFLTGFLAGFFAVFLGGAWTREMRAAV
jgi:hypothetical protein